MYYSILRFCVKKYTVSPQVEKGFERASIRLTQI